MDPSPFRQPAPRFKEGHASYVTTASSATSFYPPSDWANTPVPLPRPRNPAHQQSYNSTPSSNSSYTNTTAGLGLDSQSRARPPLPQFPASFQKHFAARGRAPSPLDLSSARISPQKQRENHPILSTTPSPRTLSYNALSGSRAVSQAPSAESPRRRQSAPFSPIIPVSPQTPLLLNSPISRQTSYDTTADMMAAPAPTTPSRFERFSRRWGLEGDEAKEAEKARRVVSREMAGMEKERRRERKWTEEEAEREKRMKAEEELEGALRGWSPLRVGGGAGAHMPQKGRRWGGCFGGRGEKAPTGREETKEEMQRRKKRRLLWSGLLLLLLLLIAGVSILLVKLLVKPGPATSATTVTTDPVVTVSGTQTVTVSVVTRTHSASALPSKTTASSSASSPSPSAPPPPVIDLTSCLADFPLKAASNTTNFCTTCLPFLTTATNDFASDGATSTGVGKALQYCGLRAIYEGVKTKADGSRDEKTLGGALNSENSPWFKETDGEVCTWGGVTCDATGRVIQLNLTYPAVPDTIPSAIGQLVALQTLSIIGNTVAAIPNGAIPTTLYSLKRLTSLTIESTAISTAIPNTAFSQTTDLQSLTLRYNGGMGTSLPTGLGGTKLTTLIVNGQSLSGNQFALLPATLTYIDLSFNSLTALASDLASSLPNVKTLLMSSNSVSTLPNSFPPNIQALSLDGNSGLSGQLPSSLCNAESLSKCTVQGTSLTGSVTKTTTVGNVSTAVTSCGVCEF